MTSQFGRPGALLPWADSALGLLAARLVSSGMQLRSLGWWPYWSPSLVSKGRVIPVPPSGLRAAGSSQAGHSKSAKFATCSISGDR